MRKARHRVAPMRANGSASNRLIIEALLAQPGRLVHIASIDDHRRLDRGADCLEVRCAEHVLFGDDRKGSAPGHRQSMSRRRSSAG